MDIDVRFMVLAACIAALGMVLGETVGGTLEVLETEGFQ